MVLIVLVVHDNLVYIWYLHGKRVERTPETVLHNIVQHRLQGQLQVVQPIVSIT